MSSYADIAAHNAPPPSQQPHADPNLLEGTHTHPDGVITQYPDVDTGKVNVVPSSQDLDHIQTDASEKNRQAEEDRRDEKKKAERQAKEAEKRVKEKAKKAEKNLEKAYKDTSKQAKNYWNRFSSDPNIWAPTLGAINVALIAGVGAYAYTHKDNTRSWDKRLVSAVTIGLVGLLGGQGYLASQKAREQKGKK